MGEVLMNPRISVIIPVYNASNTIADCIESVRRQTYQNLEIILVDDCSQDNSLDICKRYEMIDDRIKVIKHNKNGGVSEARNMGIRHASGEYLAFIDSDDTIENGMYQTMLNALIESEADMCICQFRLKDHANSSARRVMDYSYVGVYDDSYDMMRILYDEKPDKYKSFLIQVVWNKLYRRRIFDTIAFEGRFSEDYAIMNRIYSKKYRICVIENEYYNYFYTANEKSLSHTATNDQRLVYFDIYMERCKLYDDQAIRMETMRRYCDLYLMFLNDSSVYRTIQQGAYIQAFQEYVKCILRAKNGIELSSKKRCKYYLAWICPAIYRFVCAIRRRKGA